MKNMSERGSGVMWVTVPIGVQYYRTHKKNKKLKLNTGKLFYVMSPEVQQLPRMRMEDRERLSIDVSLR